MAKFFGALCVSLAILAGAGLYNYQRNAALDLELKKAHEYARKRCELRLIILESGFQNNRRIGVCLRRIEIQASTTPFAFPRRRPADEGGGVLVLIERTIRTYLTRRRHNAHAGRHRSSCHRACTKCAHANFAAGGHRSRNRVPRLR